MTAEVVTYERRGLAAWLTLSRPEKVNALSQAVLDGVHEGVRRAVADDEVKVIVVTGAGANFSAGYDIEEEVREGITEAEQWHRALTRNVEVTMALWEAPKPTVAAVRGWCLAGACELAMACDMIVAADDARFGEPEILQGSGPVTLLMPFVLGQKRTNELLFTGATIAAEEALDAGLVNRVVAGDALDDAVGALVQRIAPVPLAVLRLTKMALTRAYEAMGLRAAVVSNRDLAAVLNGADTKEQREFREIVVARGLRAALAWRNERFPEDTNG